MRELPIIFCTSMVQATLARRKTMTRRVSGLKEINQNPDEWRFAGYFDGGLVRFISIHNDDRLIKPRYQVGDHLWVKETWQEGSLVRPVIADKVIYRADNIYSASWKSALFMPKWYARLWVSVISVKAERLWDITPEDCVKEGIQLYGHEEIGTIELPNGNRRYGTLTTCFRGLWDALNGEQHPWESNPWVWVYEFERSK